MNGGIWSSFNEQEKHFQISLEWVSDFASQMNGCFCDCAEGISST